MSTEEKIGLEYQRPRRRGPWKPPWRWILIITALVIVVINTNLPNRAIGWVDSMRFAWEYHGWKSHTASPATVAYSDDPAVVSRLSGASGYKLFIDPIAHIGLIPPAGLERVGSSVLTEGLVFLHTRNLPGGTPKLIVVRIGNSRWSAVAAHSDERFTRLFSIVDDGPGSLTIGSELNLVLRLTDKFTVFAGQPDPADTSRFTIHVVANGADVELVGRLMPNNSVEFTAPVGTASKSDAWGGIGGWWPTAAGPKNDGEDPLHPWPAQTKP